MIRRTVWLAALAVGSAGVVAAANGARFGRRVTREARQMWAGAPEPIRIDRSRLEELPPPVRRYLARAVGARGTAIRAVRLRHAGAFRTTLDGGWLPIRGEQYFATDPPGFVWWGRARVAPGLWVDARDRSVGGFASMLVRAESTFTLADQAGPQLDQGALHRLLGEMVWFPTAYLDDRHVSWSAVDGHRARATLRVNTSEATGVFTFGDDALPIALSADRYRDVGGEGVLTAWSGEYADYRLLDGLTVPHEIVANWHVDGRRIPYARFQVARIELDPASPF